MLKGRGNGDEEQAPDLDAANNTRPRETLEAEPNYIYSYTRLGKSENLIRSSRGGLDT
jgi:hypothetical protein